MFCWKLSRKFFNWWYVYFVWSLDCLIEKPPVPTKREKISSIKVKSCNALLCMLLVCISSYLKSVLRYKFLILDSYHPDTLYLSEQGCEEPWLFFGGKRGLQVNKVWDTLHYTVQTISFSHLYESSEKSKENLSSIKSRKTYFLISCSVAIVALLLRTFLRHTTTYLMLSKITFSSLCHLCTLVWILYLKIMNNI
jgi:hypothetical protein